MASSGINPISSAQWDLVKARHLLNRAGFGIPESRVRQLAGMAPSEAVEYLVHYERVAEPTNDPDFLIEPLHPDEIKTRWLGLGPEERQKLSQEYNQAEREAINRLRYWWLDRMYRTPCPLQEKLALFWHGHFATSARKVQGSYVNYQLNKVFRENASGNFKSLTLAVGQSPAMLEYLDNAQSTSRQPNENWARELMELFTMGEGHYTEEDIKNSARAFTGWSCNHREFVYREQNHDIRPKTFMGRTSELDGWDIIDIIFEHPATARHICRELWMYFAYEEPENALLDDLAQTLRANNYELKPVLTQMFLSQAFYSRKAMGTQIKSPAQFVLQLSDQLGIESPPGELMAKACAALGQDLLNCPSVKGWDGNRAWINGSTLFNRYNFPAALANAAAKPSPSEKPPPAPMAEGSGSEQAPMNPMPSEAMSAIEEIRAYTSKLRAQRTGAPDTQSWRVATVASGMAFATAGQCVEALEHRFMTCPLTPQQRTLLANALSPNGANAPLTPETITEAQMRAVLHLLLSTAEYQLC